MSRQDQGPREPETGNAPLSPSSQRAASSVESREDRRLGFMLCFIGALLLLLPWVVPGGFQGVSLGLVLGKIIGIGFLAGGIYRVWTAHKALTSPRRNTPAT